MSTSPDTTTTAVLHASWDDAWRGLAAEGDGHAVRDALLAAYDTPPRAYHTREHLAECLALFERHRGSAVAPAELAMALWFHDAVYDVRGADNEARSADWAAQALHAAGVAPARIAAVRGHVLATRHDVEPADDDQALLVDIDLAILGAPAARFEAYDAQIRAEYAWVPEDIYRVKRREVLAGFLARPRLYRTAALHAALDAPARANLRRALAG